MTPERVPDFLELVTTVQDLLDEVIEPIRNRLMVEMAAGSRRPRPAWPEAKAARRVGGRLRSRHGSPTVPTIASDLPDH